MVWLGIPAEDGFSGLVGLAYNDERSVWERGVGRAGCRKALLISGARTAILILKC